MLEDATAYAEWNKDTKHKTVSLSQGKTIEELRAERGSHRVVNIAEAVELVKALGPRGTASLVRRLSTRTCLEVFASGG